MKQFFKKRIMPWLLSAALITGMTGTPVYAVGTGIRAGGLCEHHRSHTADCGYSEGAPCTHEHTEDCYTEAEKCVHKHTAECYPETDDVDDEATPANTKAAEPTECTHICDEESGCITKVLDCPHEKGEHDDSCGYSEGTPCTNVCEICANGDNTIGGNETESKGPEITACVCEELCTEDSVNGDCPVCGVAGADLTECKGAQPDNTLMRNITAWEWIDAGNYLTDGGLVLSDAGAENQTDFDAVVSMLPEKISATIEGADEPEEITLAGWSCVEYTQDEEENWPVQGEFTFSATLPEGYALSDTKELSIGVTVGEAGEDLSGMTLVEQWKRQHQRNARSSGAEPLSIHSTAQLMELATLVNSDKAANAVFRSADYELKRDIDLSGVTWTPIGTYSSSTSNKPFAGTFDGGGHKISNLTINANSSNYQGLFGYVTGTVQNVGVENANISGADSVGGVAGQVIGGNITNSYVTGRVKGINTVGGVAGSVGGGSSITNCYATGTVTGSRQYVGGVAGSINETSITNCYATGAVSGNSGIGGVAGRVGGYSSITNCYATGEVTGGNDVGGVAGEVVGDIANCAALNPSVQGASGSTNRVVGANSGNVSDNYAWNGMEVNGSAVTGGSTDDINGADLAYDSDDKTFGKAFLEIFTSNASGWNALVDSALPILTGVPNKDLQSSDVPAHIQEYVPVALEISDVNVLKNFRDSVNGGNSYSGETVVLTADIDLASAGSWTPIGESNEFVSNRFAGTFDGRGYKIKNLTINAASADKQGLFGYVTGTVQNLGVENANISANDYVGGVAGSVSSGSITNCYVTGTVTGSGDNVGGVAGSVSVSGITNSYATGTVTGSGNNVGGVAGYVAGGDITNCYATGAVSGNNNVGGVAGSVSASGIKNCYVTGTVTGSGNNVGGVAGSVSTSGITNSYATGKVSGNNNVGGVAGSVTASSASIKNCAALNPSVTGSFETTNRVVGKNESTVSGNYAWNGMKVNGSAVTGGSADNTNGADLIYNTDSNIFEKAFSAIFTGGASAWSALGNDALPILTGVPNPGLQSSDVPAHIKAGVSFDMLISNAEELAAFREKVNGGENYKGKKILLMADIDLKDVENWTPIGTDSTPFAGTFDGGGHKISNLIITGNLGFQGLFSHVIGTIQNLGVENAKISGGSYVGGVAGSVFQGRVTNCYVTGAVTGTGMFNDTVGGVVGIIEDSSIISCYATATVTGTTFVGGVVGYGEGKNKIENSYTTGAVTGSGANVGGVAGFFRGSITNCYATGAVTGSGANVGGVAGSVGGGSIKNCVALNSSVQGSSDVHRVVGKNDGGTVSGNYAWTNMGGNALEDESGATQITGSSGKLYNIDGTGEFAWPSFGSNVWTISTAATLLPQLTGVGPDIPTLALRANADVAKAVITTQPKSPENPYVYKTTEVIPLTVAATVLGKEDSSVTYQWYSNATDSNTGGTQISGATSASYIPSTNTSGTLYYYVTVTKNEGISSSTTASNTAKVIVTYPLTATVDSTDSSATKEYDGTVDFSNVKLTLTDVKSGDTVTATATGTAASVNVGTHAFTATSVALTPTSVGDHYYSLALDKVTGNVAITKKALANTMIAAIPNQTYTGNAIEPVLTVTDGTPTIIQASDYTVFYTDNTDAGTAAATITATQDGNYSGSASKTFTIGQSGSKVTIITQNGENVTDTFTYGDTITVKVTPEATGTAPANRSRARTLTAPEANQMAIFHGEIQLTVPQTVTSGTECSFAISTVEAGLTPEDAGKEYTLTAKYIGNGNMAGLEQNFDVTVKWLETEDAAELSGTGGTGGWYKSNVTLTAPTDFTICGTLDESFGSGIEITEEKTQTVTYYLKNGNGQIAKKTVQLSIDKTVPTISKVTESDITDVTATVTVTAGDGDNGSGIGTYELTKTRGTGTPVITGGGSSGVFQISGMSPNATYTFTATVTDAAGNVSSTKITFTTKKTSLKAATVTLENASTDYDGNVQTPTVTVKLGETELTQDADYTVSYQPGGGSVTAPKNAGSYTVVVTAAENGNYSGTATATPTFTINPKALTVSAVTAQDREYDPNSAAVVIIGVTLGDTCGSDDVSVDITGLKGNVTGSGSADAGQYAQVTLPSNLSLTGESSGNYTLTQPTGEVTVRNGVTISPQKVSAPTIELAIPTDGYVYDRTAKTPGVIVKDGGTTIAAEEYEVSYSDNINAGTNTAKVTIADKADGNYDITQTTKAFSIGKAQQNTLTITGQPTDSIVYGQEFALTAAGGDGDGAVTWAVTVGSSFATVNESSGEVKVTGVGNVTITATKAESSNYQAATATCTFTTARRPLTPSITPQTAVSKIYDGSTKVEQSLAIALSGTLEGDQVTATAASYAYNSANVDEADTVTALGITLSGEDSDKYALTSDTAAITGSITRATPTITFANDYKPGKTYDGTAVSNPAETDLELNGAKYADLTFTWAAAEGSALTNGTAVNAGSYTVTAKVPETANYIAAESAPLTVTVSAKEVTDPVIALAIPQGGYIYDGEAKEPAVTVRDVTTEIPAGEYTVAYSGNTNAGTNTATVTVTDQTGGNYTVNGSAAFTIAAAEPTVTVTAKKKAAARTAVGSYGDTIVLTATVSGAKNEKPTGTVQFKSGAETVGSSIAVTDGTAVYEWANADAGTYSITAEFTPAAAGVGANYKNKTSPVSSFTLDKADQTGFSITGVTGRKYGDESFTLETTGGNGDGVITYSVPEGNGVLTVSGDSATIVGAGSVTVTAVKAGNDNYNSASATRVITINKAAAPAITYPVSGSLTYGQKLSESNLTGGSTAYGDFAWADGSTVPTVENSGYAVIFTANADTVKNYETITDTTETVDITVSQAVPKLTVSAEPSGKKGSRQAVLTAALKNVDDGVFPTGTVKFVNSTDGADEDITGATAVTITDGTAVYTWTGLAEQIYRVKAIYSGDSNYQAAAGNEITFNTSRKPQAALVISTIGEKTYGDTAFSLSTTGGTGTGAVTFISSDPDVITIDGATATIRKAGTVKITAVKAGDDDYKEMTAEVSVTVAKKAVTVTAEDKAVVEGGPMPVFTYRAPDLVNGDTFTAEPAMTTTVTDTNTPGEYDIIINGGTLTNADSYHITYVNGKLTVAKRQLYAVTVTNGAADKTQAAEGDTVTVTADERSGYTFTGWSSADTVLADSTAKTTTFIMPAKAVTITAEYRRNSSGGSSGGGSGSGGGSSSGGGGGASSGAAPSSGTTTTDAKKGSVNSQTGIITGSGDGYSKWIPEVSQGQTAGATVSETVRWKLQYADGTFAVGTYVTDAQGNVVKDAAGNPTEQLYWEQVNGAWYAFGTDGYAKSGLLFDTALNGWFYVDINTGMKVGWQLINGKWYYFNPVSDGTRGKMAVSTTVDGYKVDENGVWVQE